MVSMLFIKRTLLALTAVVAVSTAGGHSAYEPWCSTDGVSKGTGAVLCNSITDAAKEIFNETLGGNFSLLIGHKDKGRILEAKFGIDSSTVEAPLTSSHRPHSLLSSWTPR